MSEHWFLIVSAVAVLACGLVAGVFLTFSDFVMKSLAASPPAGAIEAMQVINRKVYRTLFMALLLGMAALSPLLIGGAALTLSGAALTLSGAAALWIVAGATLYLVGVFLVSLLFNVPMNRRLDVLDPAGPEAASYWRTYVPVWSLWNWIRALSAGGAALCFLIACLWLANGCATPAPECG